VAFVAGALAATTERVVVNRFPGLAIEGSTRWPIHTDARPLVDGRASTVPGRRHLAFPQRGQRASFVADPEILQPAIAATTRSDVPPRRAFAGNPAVLADLPASGSLCSAAKKTRDAFAARPELVQEAPSSCRIW